MNYKVELFHPNIKSGDGYGRVADKLEDAINKETIDGWEFVSLQSMTYTSMPSGCLSFFGKSETMTIQMLIFNRVG